MLQNYFTSYIHPLSFTWSLSIEEHFYIIFPFLFYFLIKIKNSNYRNILISIIVCLPVFYKYYLAYISPPLWTHEGIESGWAHYINVYTHARYNVIGYGCILAGLFQYKKDIFEALRKKSLILMVILLVLLVFIFSINSKINSNLLHVTTFYDIPELFFAFLLVNFVSKEFNFKKLLITKIFLVSSRLSYALYLFHFLAISCLRIFFLEYSTILKFIIFISLSYIFSTIAYLLIEKPFLNYRERLIEKMSVKA